MSSSEVVKQCPIQPIPQTAAHHFFKSQTSICPQYLLTSHLHRLLASCTQAFSFAWEGEKSHGIFCILHYTVLFFRYMLRTKRNTPFIFIEDDLNSFSGWHCVRSFYTRLLLSNTQGKTATVHEGHVSAAGDGAWRKASVITFSHLFWTITLV